MSMLSSSCTNLYLNTVTLQPSIWYYNSTMRRPSIQASWLRPTFLGSQKAVPPGFHLLLQDSVYAWGADGAQGIFETAGHVYSTNLLLVPSRKRTCAKLWCVLAPDRYWCLYWVTAYFIFVCQLDASLNYWLVSVIVILHLVLY